MDDCPHCHALVLLMGDRICPACRKSADDPKGATPHLRRLVLSDGQTGPPVCLSCGAKTDRQEMFRTGRQVGGASTAGKTMILLLAILAPLKMLHLFFSKDVAGEKQKVMVNLFRCEACAAQGPVVPLHVNFERRTASFLGHRRVQEALLKQAST